MYVILAEISAAIITLFVILDPVGVLPFFIGLTHNISVSFLTSGLTSIFGL